MLGVYFGEEDSLFGSQQEEEGIQLGVGDLSEYGQQLQNEQPKRKRTARNADPIETARPRVDYETKVPNDSTIIANISYRRVDRITPKQAARTDACLPCGRDTTEHPDLLLFKLPCEHTWCKVCLARCFHFAIWNQTFGQLRCCTDDEIPLSYFKNIKEDRIRPRPEYEAQPDSTANAEDKGQQILPGLRDWNPIKVTAYVEKDREPFITSGDIASYRASLEEYESPPKDKVYCWANSCGSFIPKGSRTKTEGKCRSCRRRTCLRCRKSLKSHTSESGKCTASKKRLQLVKNDTKLLSLARRKGWKRCPRCKVFIQKIRGGCSSVICRCGRCFYY